MDTFYSDLRAAINDNTSENNDDLLPCPDAMFQEQYDLYLSIQALGKFHPSNPVIPIDERNNVLIQEWINLLLKMRVIMIKNLTKSGMHNMDAFFSLWWPFVGFVK